MRAVIQKSDKTNAHSAVGECFERSDQPKLNLLSYPATMGHLHKSGMLL